MGRAPAVVRTEASRNARSRAVTAVASRPELLVVYGVLVGLACLGFAVSSNFFTSFNLTSIAGAAPPLALAALGETFVMIAGGIDLSIGALMSLTSVVAAMYLNGADGRLPMAIVICIGIGVATGLVNGFIVVFLRVQPIIATLGTLSILEGLTLLRTNTPAGLVSPLLSRVIYNRVGPVPEAVILLAVVFAVAFVLLQKTSYGMHVYSVGGDEEAARLSGVSVRRVKMSTYVISGIAGSCAGLFLLARLEIGDPTSGQPFMLLAIVAAAIGGTNIFGGRGRIVGTLGGVLIVTALGNVLNLMGVSSYPQQLINGLLIIVVVALYSIRVWHPGSRRPEGEEESEEQPQVKSDG
jgi:ribose transport system permease protein